jgi:mRNA interferase MazF
MKEGDVVLTPLLQADGKIKNRPAIFLREMPPFQDILVCGVSTQVHQLAPDFDEIITRQDSDFSSSGLIAESLVRLGFLADAAAQEHCWQHRCDSARKTCPPVTQVKPSSGTVN